MSISFCMQSVSCEDAAAVFVLTEGLEQAVTGSSMIVGLRWNSADVRFGEDAKIQLSTIMITKHATTATAATAAATTTTTTITTNAAAATTAAAAAAAATTTITTNVHLSRTHQSLERSLA